MKQIGTRTAVLLAILLACTASAIPPRKDINPALLYFQAFNALPELDESESALLTSEASSEVSDEERAVAARFDAAFKLLVRARGMKTRCDWGTDLADGPHAFTPNVRHIRTLANAALLRARAALADNRQAQAREELLAVSVLARNAAVEAWLVGVMVQVAVDNKILDFIDAHFDELKPQTRAELAAGLKGEPQRSTAAQAVANEQAGFTGWLIDRIEVARAKNTNDAHALDTFRAAVTETFSHGPDVADRIIEAAGGTSTGVIRYIRAVEPYYARSVRIARAPANDLDRGAAEFEKALNETTNLIARIVIPNVVKARKTELKFEARLNQFPNTAP
jgi:hypothetical protein